MDKPPNSIVNAAKGDLLKKPVPKYLLAKRRSKTSEHYSRVELKKISLRPLNSKKTPSISERRHMRLVRLFRLTKDHEPIHDAKDNEMDGLMLEIDEIVRSCNFFSVRRTNHPVSLDLKQKLLSPIKRSAPKLPNRMISRMNSINTFKSKINESYCDIEEVSEISEDSIQEPEDPEAIIYERPTAKSLNLKLPVFKMLKKDNSGQMLKDFHSEEPKFSNNLKLPALKIIKNEDSEHTFKDNHSEETSFTNLRRDSSRSLIPRRSLSTNSIGSTTRRIYFTKRSFSNNRGASPFQIVSNFNRNGPNRQKQLDHFNRPSGFKSQNLEKSQETSLSFSLFDEYVSELEKIKTLKNSFPESDLKEIGSSDPVYAALPKIKEKVLIKPKPAENWVFPKPKPVIPMNDPLSIELKRWQSSLSRHRRAISTLNNLLNQASKVVL